jgi:hypothetical protein
VTDLQVEPVGGAAITLLRELMDGAATDVAWVLNPGDRGLLASLDALSADAASARPGGRSSIAAHVDHVRYGLELLNRWARGDENAFATADYGASWRRQQVSSAEWGSVRAALASEAHAWQTALAAPRDWGSVTLTGVPASIVHLAYHVGAIRQIDAAASGPRARD